MHVPPAGRCVAIPCSKLKLPLAFLWDTRRPGPWMVSYRNRLCIVREPWPLFSFYIQLDLVMWSSVSLMRMSEMTKLNDMEIVIRSMFNMIWFREGTCLYCSTYELTVCIVRESWPLFTFQIWSCDLQVWCAACEMTRLNDMETETCSTWRWRMEGTCLVSGIQCYPRRFFCNKVVIPPELMLLTKVGLGQFLCSIYIQSARSVG
jgi:hypothetical protein